MNANLMTKKIEMTKTEAKAAGKPNTAEYNTLLELMKNFPGFQIEIVKSAAKKVDRFKGLDYDYMEAYIMSHSKEIEMNKKTKALTTEQYKQIIQTMKEGFCGCRPNERVATALVLEGNLGLRISDIVKLRPREIVQDGDRYRLEIVEQKTGKRRVFTVPLVIAQYIENYCLRNGIGKNDLIFPITERAVQKQLALVCGYLGIEGVSTHSFRKWYATEIYRANGFDIALVQRLLQHSSAAVTQRYIGIEPQRIEAAIQGHAQLL